MPEGTEVERVYKALRREGKSEESAARIAQAETGQALATGKPPKHENANRVDTLLKKGREAEWSLWETGKNRYRDPAFIAKVKRDMAEVIRSLKEDKAKESDPKKARRIDTVLGELEVKLSKIDSNIKIHLAHIARWGNASSHFQNGRERAEAAIRGRLGNAEPYPGFRPGAEHNRVQNYGERTQIDHVNYPKQLRKKTYAQLQFIIKDAGEAMRAMPEGHKAGYYADEINYAQMELERRRKGGKVENAADRGGRRRLGKQLAPQYLDMAVVAAIKAEAAKRGGIKRTVWRDDHSVVVHWVEGGWNAYRFRKTVPPDVLAQADVIPAVQDALRTALGVGTGGHVVNAFSSAQIQQLVKAYSGIKTITTEGADKLRALLKRASDKDLIQLAQSDAPFVRTVAWNICRERGLDWRTPVKNAGVVRDVLQNTITIQQVYEAMGQVNSPYAPHAKGGRWSDPKVSKVIDEAVRQGWVRRPSTSQAEWTEKGVRMYKLATRGGS
jgi:hypothetical protein